GWMEGRRIKISDSNFARLSVCGLNSVSKEQDVASNPTKFSPKARDEISTTRATNAASGGIDAADLLGYFYSEGDYADIAGYQPAFLQEESSDSGKQTAGQDRSETVLNESLRNDFSDMDLSEVAFLSDATLAEAADILALDRRSVLGLVTI